MRTGTVNLSQFPLIAQKIRKRCLLLQKLTFESKWDKTIADQDRGQIKQFFQEAILVPAKNIQFTSLWQAKNHRGELLVTVLIHNISQRNFSFVDQQMTYLVNDSFFAKHTFSSPITIEKQTSMPWTFIFPASTLNSDERFEDGVLRITP